MSHTPSQHHGFNTANVCGSHKHVCKSKNSATEYFLYSICKLYFCIFNQRFEENKNAKMLFFANFVLYSLKYVACDWLEL